MSILGPKIDVLLANRLQRADLWLKPVVQTTGLEPVTKVIEVVNDVHLPSRMVVEQRIGTGLPESDRSGPGGLPGRSERAVTLSAASLVVSAVLDSKTGAASRVLGSALVMPWTQFPTSEPTATALSRLVSHSGLFYESHLAQFAAGTRSLAEMDLEPQARLVGGWLAGVPAEPDSSADPARQTPIPEMAHAYKNRLAAIDTVEASTLFVKGKDDTAPDAARSAPVIAGIHQDVMGLVRQQLEVLAQSVFRWSGEAWPSVPMDWEIHADQRQTSTTDEEMPHTWNTRLTLTLPTLRDIDVRISLSGNALQVRLAASEDATRERLDQARTELPARLSAHGLDLTGLQISSPSIDAAMPGTLEASDVA